uniref:RP1 axonemal microtubule associated n=1 Tax=Sinocyclocheilus grahami TaxID=75366 RepID=A0A672MKC5_SINGR
MRLLSLNMSTTHLNDAPHPDVSVGTLQTLVSRPLHPQPDPITTKRVCFYKSGDPQFTGHRMVINSRTFKTFDALLDALSKKVPLPFGVRTITTPRGTHVVHTLDDVQDGGSYLCSDQKKIKPFNLDEIHKRQVPWNTTRPASAGHQAQNTVVVRTPKRVTVYNNRDPSMKRVIVLHRRTAPNFQALLDYLSQVMQFPVVKLYTEDGRRVSIFFYTQNHWILTFLAFKLQSILCLCSLLIPSILDVLSHDVLILTPSCESTL